MSVKLEFVGHACFRIWENGRPVIMTDPFAYDTLELPDPGTRFETDTVIVSSLTDPAHDNVALAKGSPRVINALDVALGKDDSTIGAEPIVTLAVAEDPDHTLHAPMDNAMYAFNVGGLWFYHMGDLGYAVTPEQLAPFKDHCEVMIPLTGEKFTPKHEELDLMIDFLKPRWIVPMHYAIPPVIFDMMPIDKFLAHRSQDPVLMVRHHTVEFPLPTPKSDRPTIVVLDPSGYQRTDG